MTPCFKFSLKLKEDCDIAKQQRWPVCAGPWLGLITRTKRTGQDETGQNRTELEGMGQEQRTENNRLTHPISELSQFHNYPSGRVK